MSLDDFLAERRAVRFSWGEQDCCTFAADWVRLRTGHDPMAGLRGLTTAKDAMRRITAHGGFLAGGTQLLGEPIGPLFAQVGDICLLPTGRRQTLARGFAFGVCNGSVVALVGMQGLVFAPIAFGVAAWRIRAVMWEQRAAGAGLSESELEDAYTCRWEDGMAMPDAPDSLDKHLQLLRSQVATARPSIPARALEGGC